MIRSVGYKGWLKKALIGAAVIVLVNQGTVRAAEESSDKQTGAEETWSASYRAMRSILDTQLMQKGIPQTLGVGSITYEESDAVVIASQNSAMKVVETSEARVSAESDAQASAASDVQTAAVYIEDNQSETGPSVQEVTLEETYYSDYEIYSESIAGYYFFYASTGNNSITDQSVYLDIPANITYTVQKDGVDFSYTSKQRISEMGTYVFEMTAVKNPEAPIAEQEIYQATYNFRIQQKASESVSEDEADHYADYDSFSFYELEEDSTEELTETVETVEMPIEEITETETSEAVETMAGLEDDVTPPECELQETDNGVKILYDAEDVVQIILSDGETETYYESISEVTAAGSYTLYLYDAAGNVNEVSFQIAGKSGVNAASVIFILMVIALIAAGVIYYRRTRNNLNLK